MLALFLYDQGSQHQKREKSALTEKLIKLTKEKEEALALQEDLHLQITSQEDPEYIEMILMRKLGLIQEGQVKLLFQSSQAQE